MLDRSSAPCAPPEPYSVAFLAEQFLSMPATEAGDRALSRLSAALTCTVGRDEASRRWAAATDLLASYNQPPLDAARLAQVAEKVIPGVVVQLAVPSADGFVLQMRLPAGMTALAVAGQDLDSAFGVRRGATRVVPVHDSPNGIVVRVDPFSVDAVVEFLCRPGSESDCARDQRLYEQMAAVLGTDEAIRRMDEAQERVAARVWPHQQALIDRALDSPGEEPPNTVLGRLQHVALVRFERPDDQEALLGLTWRDVRGVRAGLEAAVEYARSQQQAWYYSQGPEDAADFPPELRAFLGALTPLVTPPPVRLPEIEGGTVLPVTMQVEIEDGQVGRHVVGRTDIPELPFVVVDGEAKVAVGPPYDTYAEARTAADDLNARGEQPGDGS